MNKLYFVRMVPTGPLCTGQAVFLFTANDEADASNKGMQSINPIYVHEWSVDKVEFVCNTPDTINGFEPC